MERFIIEKSKEKENHWVCTDQTNLIVCVFENRKYNDTQSFTTLKDFDNINALQLATIAKEMGEWLRKNHYNKVF